MGHNRAVIIVLCALFLAVQATGCMRVIKYNPNADLVRESIRQAIAQSKMPGIKKGEKVTIVNAERLKSEEFLPDSIIQDELMRAVTMKGATVVQKDDEVLVHMVHEASGDTLPYAVTTRHGEVENPFPYDARVESHAESKYDNGIVPTLPSHALDYERRLESLYEKETPRKAKNESTVNQALKTSTTKTSVKTVQYLRKEEPKLFARLKTASRVLSYRVIECGLDYSSAIKTSYPWYTLWLSPVERLDRKKVQREAKTILDLQIADAKTGLVFYADTLKSTYSDVVPKKIIPHAEVSHNAYYAYNMPNISDAEKGRTVTGRLDPNLGYKDTVDEVDEWVDEYLPWFIGIPVLLTEKIIFEPADIIRWFRRLEPSDPYVEMPSDQFEGSVDGPVVELDDSLPLVRRGPQESLSEPAVQARVKQGFWSGFPWLF
ncbi:MAG: hypothetical protein GY868_08780 [Deltaproteobacteria bacterium]|nr:hypothetical protein [Deltaproteobacteria bacterium]